MCALGIGFMCAAAGNGTAASAWRPPVIPLRSAIVLHGGFQQAVHRALQRLSAPPYNLDFILADVNFNQQRIFTEYSGDISGRMVSMIARERRFGLPESWPLEKLLAGLQAAQQPDGHFGKPQDLAHDVVGDRDMPILWGNGRLLTGLVEICEVSPNQRALAMARRLGDYYLATDPYLDRPELVNRFGNYAAGFATCYFSGIEGLAGLARVTHDHQYLAQAQRIARLMMENTKPGEQHSHGRLCALRGLLDLYIATGDAAYLRYVTHEFQYTADHFLWPTGGLSEMSVPTFQRDEGCTEADWLRLCIELWRLTGRDEYMDYAEWILANEMAVNQFPNGGFGHHTAFFTAGVMDGYEAVNPQTAQEAYWCCSEHCPRALLDAASWAVVARDGDVFLNLYEPLTTKVVAKGKPVSISIEPSSSGRRIRIGVTVRRPVRLALHLRKPAWCTRMMVDGHEEGASRSGRIVLDRVWRDTTFVDLQFSDEPRVWWEGLPLFGVPLREARPKDDALVVLLLSGRVFGRDPGSSPEPPVILRSGASMTQNGDLMVRALGGGELLFHPISRIARDGSGFRLRVKVVEEAR